MSEPVHEDGVTPVAQEDWDDLREANKVLTQSLREENAAAVKAIHALAAAERTVREQREALEAISEFGCDECGDFGDTCLDRHSTEPTKWCQTCIALAALAPDTEGEGTADATD